VVEVRSTLATSQSYDDNVLTRETNEIDDQVTTVTPELSLRARSERGSIGGSGRLNWRKYAEVDALDALDRAFTLEGDYWLSPRLQLSAYGRDAYYQNTDEFIENGVPVLGDNPELDTLQLNGSLRYLLSPRTALSLSPTFSDWNFGSSDDPDADERSDSRSRGISAGLERSLSAKDAVGLSFTEARNEFQGDPGVSDNESRYHQARLSWSRTWGPVWTSALSAGATQVKQDGQELDFQELPGERDPSSDIDDTSLSGVGELLLTRRTPWTTFQLSASQSVTPSSGLGTDLTVLTVSSRLDWQLNRRWTLSVGAFWTDSQATGEVLAFTTPIDTRGDIIVNDPTIPDDPTLLFQHYVCDSRSAAITTGVPQGASFAFDADGNLIFDSLGNPVIGERIGTACMGATDSSVDYQQTGFNLGLSWRMTRRFSTFLRYRFLDQSNGGDTELEEYNQNVVSLGFTYRYDVDLY
jgi:hypothetical protein